MKPITTPKQAGWRYAAACATVITGASFAYALAQLMGGRAAEAGPWRFLSVASLYACVLLARRWWIATARRARSRQAAPR
ncbi:hypothetical protein DVT68_14865 [Dyella solisilvae]|uniref:DUF3649 domain-containing protein n=1 Tax=Dyella solisilvae TaxID=1920168 RepID=A0A370K4I0_9GAMM|nr:hypothetical protein [Dyella solisilvae]RDI97575.1 hypothetical protein DVT68_14865 [Dyella solisilvae]